ncbi:MAG: type II toxin-antitoxin system Phd/YefM family antitoxin, partial [Deinococcota bacterium]|nr:type II toxin-antitoxin system Phd/YefM family antitoxin [Deinococcota bacterium]
MIKALPKTVSAAEARANFAEIVGGLAAPEAAEVVITRHGRPVAVLLSAERYSELIATLETLE